MRFFTVFAMALSTMATVQAARAEPFQINFFALVTSADSGLGLPVVGSNIHGAITFDEASGLPIPGPGCVPCGFYSYRSPPSQYVVDLGTSTLVTQNVGVGVYDNSTLLHGLAAAPNDFVEFTTKSGPSPWSFFLTLSGDALAFSGTALPTFETLRSLGQQGRFEIFNNQLQSVLRAQLTGFSIASVPEPSAAILFAIGVGSLVLRHRGQRTQAHQAVTEG